MKQATLTSHIMAFAAVAVLFMSSYAFIDQPLALWLHQHTQAQVTEVATFISHYFKAGTFYAPVVLLAAYSWFTHKRNSDLCRYSLLLTFIYVVNAILCTILKIAFSRARPTELYYHHAYGFHYLQLHASYWSFPSGHAFVASTFFSFIAIVKPKLRWWCLLGVLLMCVARMVVGAHYLGDVMVGSFLGYWTSKFMISRFENQLPFKLEALLQGNTSTSKQTAYAE
jgi:membrane-associated phospholipid phosphatase